MPGPASEAADLLPPSSTTTTSSTREVNEQITNTIAALYALEIQAHDHHGGPTATAMAHETQRLAGALQALARAARTVPTHAPADLVAYIESGRNPDIYNRNMVEGVARSNQRLGGVGAAWADMRDVLAREIVSGVPELRGAVEGVVGAVDIRGAGERR